MISPSSANGSSSASGGGDAPFALNRFILSERASDHQDIPTIGQATTEREGPRNTVGCPANRSCRDSVHRLTLTRSIHGLRAAARNALFIGPTVLFRARTDGSTGP